jgi:hypothetical protein
MEPERIELSQRERDRLKVLYEVEQGHLTQVQAAARVELSDRQVRRLLVRVRQEGDRGVVHRLRGRPSNRKIPAAVTQQALRLLRRPCYGGFGPTLAAEHLARAAITVSRETLRGWMSQAGLWCPRRQKVAAVHLWRERRAAFGELVLLDTSEHAWLEERGPKLCLIALIDDATSRLWARFTEHDTTEENLRTLEGWLCRYGRPVALYTDKDSIFQPAGPPSCDEQLRGEPARTQFGRALAELGIEWIPAHSPQAKGRIERAFGTLQDRLIKELRVASIDTLAAANRFLEITFLPQWEQRFTIAPRQPRDAHRRLGREHRLEEILSVRVARTVANDYTVRWNGQRWGVPREAVCAGLRGARVEIERRLDGRHWLRFRSRYLPLRLCEEAAPSLSAVSLRLTAGRKPDPKPRKKYHPPADHQWRRPWKRTVLLCREPDISTSR